MTGYMYVKGKKLYDKYDNEILLKGVGLGGWMLPEGYMWGSHKYYDRPRRFEELIAYYMEDEQDLWWNRYYKTWISDEDFKLIKQHGYNSVRLPMNYRMLMVENDIDNTVEFKEYGFKMIDYTIRSCEENGLYVILDLHGAPGGQTGANIDDSKDDYPHLYETRIYQEQLITLWKEIAKRYNNNNTVCMLDLLNEPIPAHFSHLNHLLEPLHEELIHEIRTVNKNHIICIEGNNWASDFSTITKKLDDNLVLHFHKYWNPSEVEQIQRFLDKQDELNLPLYMGEGGENDLYWYSSNFKMYDQLNISWNFWAYKKRENHNSVISFNLPKNWNSILDKENPISKEEGKRILMEFLENIKFDNCNINHDVSNSLFYKDEFFTTGGSYDYTGRGKGFDIANEYYNSNMRSNDYTQICDHEGNPFNGVWGCHSEEQLKQELFPFVKGNKGDYYNYTFHVTRKVVSRISITHNNLEAEFFVNNEPVYPRVLKDEYVLHIDANIGENVLTIRPLNSSVIKVITFR